MENMNNGGKRHIHTYIHTIFEYLFRVKTYEFEISSIISMTNILLIQGGSNMTGTDLYKRTH